MDRSNSPTMHKVESSGLQVITFSHPTWHELFVTAVPVGDEPPEAMFTRAAAIVRENGATVVSQEVFGIEERNGEGMHALDRAFGQIDWPVTWIEPANENGPAGAQLWAVSGVTVAPIRLDGIFVGSVFEDEYGQYCRLGDVLPTGTEGMAKDQARETFEKMDRALQRAGMEFTHVVRTWFFNDDILSWYGEFNEVRHGFFSERHVYDGLVPASTGIGGRNRAGAALVGGLLALKAKDTSVQVMAVPSPLQCPPLEYGSSFSRAAEIVMPDHRRLFISGTASVAPTGETVHVDNMDGQVKCTIEVVTAILESRDMNWADVVRGVAYFRHADDVHAYTRFCADHGLSSMPIVLTENVICRDDLLFELEVDAVQKS